MYNHKTCNLESKAEFFSFSKLYRRYFKEIHKDSFKHIDNIKAIENAIESAMRDSRVVSIVGIYKERELIGFFDFRIENEYGIVADFIYVRYMYIKPEHRNSLCISYIYEVLSLMSYMNDGIKIVGDTYVTSPNDNNNVIAEGDIISKTWVFEPTKTQFGKKLIDKGIKRYLRREELSYERE